VSTPPDISPPAVAAALAGVGLSPGGSVEVERLSGGYSWVTLRVDMVDRSVIVRVAPEGGTVEPYDPASEARILHAVEGVVPAPAVLAVEGSADNPIGRPFGVYSLCPGSVVRRPEEPERYRHAFADALAAIHRDGDPTALATRPDAAGGVPTVGETYRQELARVTDAFADTWAHPGWIVALRWLWARLPESAEPGVVCHGDFRPANILWTAPGEIGGVLDWERARAGDPLADVAFTWHLGGWAALDGDLLDRYLAASGTRLDEERLAYALRFERVRSHLSGSQGLRAFVDGRADDDRLVAVGESGEVGMWDLVEWIVGDPTALHAPGLPPLDPTIVERALARGGYPVDDTVAGRVSDERLRAHLSDWFGHDRDDLGRSLDELGQFVPVDTAAVASDPEAVWGKVFADLCREAATAGPELLGPLRALGARFASRPTRFPKMEWR
jgi:aminoglycoside phosphotransferase (APT) family kinase protein